MSNFFSDLFSKSPVGQLLGGKDAIYGTDPEILTKSVTDPSKQAVNNPLSAFLASNIGKGVPRYEGKLTGDLPYGGGGSVNDFLGLSYGTLKDEASANFRNNYSDLLESSAGALSSSSRAYNDVTALTGLELGLADKRQGLATAQYDIASRMQAAETASRQAEYQEWIRTQPEYSPILDKAIAYLNDQTSTGTTVLSALDPGKQGIMGDLIKAAATAAGGA